MTLRPITDDGECKAAQHALAKHLKTGAAKVKKLVGWPHGHRDLTLYWRDDEEFWVSFGIGESGSFWCPFGRMNPFEHPSVNISCQINVPIGGVNRRFGGVFLSDGNSGVYLAHSGNIGGGGTGIGKNAFLDSYRGGRQEIEWPDGVISEVILLGKVGGRSLCRNISDYLEAVDDFKAEAKGHTPSTLRHVPEAVAKKNPGLTFTPEFAGARKKYSLTASIESLCSHGTVVDSLYDEITSMGLKGYNNKNIDLFLADKHESITHVLEIKTDLCTTNIYQAVGQVMIHGALAKNEPHRILVLPGKVSALTAARLKPLGIRVLSYRWRGKKPIFDGLKAVLKG